MSFLTKDTCKLQDSGTNEAPKLWLQSTVQNYGAVQKALEKRCAELDNGQIEGKCTGEG